MNHTSVTDKQNSSPDIKKTICYVAGKSGGHIIPALTLAQQFKTKNPDYTILFFSTTTELDKKIIQRNTLVDVHVPLKLDNIPRKNILQYPKFLWELVTTKFTIFYTLLKYQPEKIISMGGYISVPVCLIAKILRIPVEVYELNATPGAAVKLLSYFANKTFICFNNTQKLLPRTTCTFTNYPVRFTEKNLYQKAEACSRLGISPTKKVILVLGGSQGSLFINKLMQDFVTKSPRDFYIIHQTGERDIQELTNFYTNNNQEALVFAYRADLDLCYSAADLIIARAGAGTLFEILHFKKQAIIIPLETTITDHQLHNAQAMAEHYPQLFTVVRQSDIAHQQLFVSIIKNIQFE